MSWFTYERPGKKTSERQIKLKRPLYIDCGFQTMNQLGEEMSQGNATKCARIAWRAILGLQGFMSHNRVGSSVVRHNYILAEQASNFALSVIFSPGHNSITMDTTGAWFQSIIEQKMMMITQ